MKRINKKLITIMLVFALTISLSPISSMAKASSPNGTIGIAKKSSVYAVLYPGAKPKKASFEITCQNSGTTIINNVENEIYNITVIIKKDNLTSAQVVGTWKDLKRKGGAMSDYSVVIVDQKGNRAKNYTSTGGFTETLSVPTRRIKGKSGKKTYYINGWRKQTGYSFRLMIPKGHTPMYIGVTGLRGGQLSKNTKKRYLSGKLGFYAAGFGSKKAGYCYVTRIN